MRRILPAALMALWACSVSGPEQPLPSSVQVMVVNPHELTVSGPLRYAVVWTLGEGEGIVVTADGSVDAIEGLLEVPLELPSVSMLSDLDPIETLAMNPAGAGSRAPSHRPHLVVYSDVDTNGLFEPAVLGVNGPDSVFAIDDGRLASVAAFLDLDKALSRFSIEEAGIFYRATDGRYTPFVRVIETYPGFVVIDISSSEPMMLTLRDSPVPEAQLACRREYVLEYGSGVYATSRVALLVDDALDAAAVCGAAIPDCTSVDLETMGSPSLEPQDTGDDLRLIQCRTSVHLESLVIHEAERVCEECVCTMRASVQAFIVDPALPPTWWPCGDAIDYCDSQLPLYVIDPECVPEEPDG
jgi:hypothetical protein